MIRDSGGHASGVLEYLSSIQIAVAQVDTRKQEVTLFNEYSETLLSGQTPEEQYDYLSDFLELTEIKQTETFHGQRRKMVLGNQLLSVHTLPVNEHAAWVFLQDVTDMVRLESIAEAVNIMDNIGYIFSGIRHEIGNPINTIKMTMSVLKKNLEGLSREKIENYVDRTLEEVLRLEELLQSLKSYNMFDKPSPRNLHLPTFMNKFISLVEQDFCTEGVNIKIYTSSGLWACVDPRGLQQVMLNVITNAFDALRLTESPQITISMYRFVNQVCIKITDNGCGIPESQMNDLFQPFYTTKAKGTGLGLVISRKILKAMGCSIRIQ
ncbi:MAG TPA: HAMP domain-containing sensor histidine kinase, partial [bacterium]|nr:HAMP domain-containing sensor histidine kinase [bacterium]